MDSLAERLVHVVLDCLIEADLLLGNLTLKELNTIIRAVEQALAESGVEGAG